MQTLVSVFSVFQIVQFQNEACTTMDGLIGSCYTAAECTTLGGGDGGPCAKGFGVCCKGEFVSSILHLPPTISAIPSWKSIFYRKRNLCVVGVKSGGNRFQAPGMERGLAASSACPPITLALHHCPSWAVITTPDPSVPKAGGQAVKVCLCERPRTVCSHAAAHLLIYSTPSNITAWTHL